MKHILTVLLLVCLFVLPQQASAQQASDDNSMRRNANADKFQKRVVTPTTDNFEQKITEIRLESQITNNAKEDTFRKSLRKNKSLTKIASAEKITTKFKEISTLRTDQIARIITKFDEILIKIKVQRDMSASAGAQIAMMDATIASAESALTNAKTLVTAQAQKEYTPTATDDAYLKYSLGTSMKQLQSDLQMIRKALQGTKQALITSAIAVKTESGTKTDMLISPQPTGTPVVTQKVIDTSDAEVDDPTPKPLPENY